MTVSVQPWEVQQRRRRQLTIVVMGVVVAICFLAVVYELG
jgi:Tfp pilus assembly protein PilN